MLRKVLAAAVAAWFAVAAPAWAATQIVITSGTTWTVPADWSSAGAKVEAIGGGGTSAGGNYAEKTTGLTGFHVGQVISVQIGSATGSVGSSGTGATCFNGCTFLQATSQASSGSVGDVTYLGGTTVNEGTYTQYGGAAGPHGNGINGGAGDAGYGGFGSSSCGSGGSGNGGNGSEIAPGVGSGGGACGGGVGGNYGGSGGGGGKQGVLVITYNPAHRSYGGAF